MEPVKYKTSIEEDTIVSITPCTKRKGDRMVGSRLCCECSYCYDVDREKQVVLCRKVVI